jgi:hypothetical protein
MLKRLFDWFLGNVLWDATKLLCLAGGSIMTTATQAFYSWWKGHPNAEALLIVLVEVLLLLVVALVVSRASKPTRNPLTILSAQWGTGNNAYVDVTKIVCARAKPDSIVIPASIDLFGDPYPYMKKHLKVIYSIPTKHEVKVDENTNLILPQPDGGGTL